MQLLYTIITAMTMMCVGVEAARLPSLRNQGVADVWTSVLDANVTFSSTFCCNANDAEVNMRNVLANIEALRFCFSDVLLIIDVPHGGIGPPWPLAEGSRYEPGGHSKFLKSSMGAQMIAAARKTAQAAVALLQSRCPLRSGPLHPPTWKVDVLNYDEPAMRMALKSDFGINANGSVSSIFSSMYKNTMAYDRLWHHLGAQYVWHSDADWRVYRFAKGASPNFIESSISLLRSDSRVMITAPTKFHVLEDVSRTGGVGKVSKFDAEWYQGETRSHQTFLKLRQPASTDTFFVDVQKSRQILPFKIGFIGQSMEQILAYTLMAKGAYCVNFDCSTHLVAESTHYRNFTGSEVELGCATLSKVLS